MYQKRGPHTSEFSKKEKKREKRKEEEKKAFCGIVTRCLPLPSLSPPLSPSSFLVGMLS